MWKAASDALGTELTNREPALLGHDLEQRLDVRLVDLAQSAPRSRL
jgi:hypothetical protein